MTFKGVNVVEKSPRYSWSRIKGPTVTRVFDGALPQLIALYDVLTAPGQAEDLNIDDKGDGTGILTAVYYDDWNRTGAGAAAATNTFELLGNDLMKDILDHPKTKLIDAYDRARATSAKPAQLLDVIKREANSSDVKSERLIRVQAAMDGIDLTASNYAFALFDDMCKRMDYFPTSQFVFRHTKAVGSAYTQIVDLTNVNRIYSTSELKAELAASGSDIPSTVLVRIENIPPPVTGSYDTKWFFWGWVKKTPTVTASTLNRFTIVQEWWLETWSLYHYDRKS